VGRLNEGEVEGMSEESRRAGGRYRIEVEAKDLDILRLRAFLHDQFGARVLKLVRTGGPDAKTATTERPSPTPRPQSRHVLGEAVFELMSDGLPHRMRDINVALGKDCSYAIKKMLREGTVFRAGRGHYMRSDFRRPKPSDPNYRVELETDKRRILDLLDRPMSERELREILKTSPQDLAHKLEVLEAENAIERIPVTDTDKGHLYLKRSRPLLPARTQGNDG